MPPRTLKLMLFLTLLSGVVSCTDSGKLSVQKAKAHLAFLSKAVKEDVREVRHGLPLGAAHLQNLYKNGADPKDDLKAVRLALFKAREAVQDLRVAKSTFFAVADPNGTVLRNDQEQDAMAGKNLFRAFPALRQALSGKYVETTGSMPAAARVKGPDGQWVAAQPIRVDGSTRGLYVTGWSWSAYAYRLETAIRDQVQSKLHSGDNMPLLYVYVVVSKNVYGAPVSPAVNRQAIAKLDPLSKTTGGHVFATQLKITGRTFGLAVEVMPVLGPHVGVVVLRSET